MFKNNNSYQLLLIDRNILLDVIKEVSCPPPKEILTAKDTCEELGISKNTLYKLTSARKIPHFKRGNFLFFKRHEIYHWIEDGRVKTVDQLKSEI